MRFLTKRLLFIVFLAAGQRAVTTWQEMLDLLVTVARDLGLYPTVLVFRFLIFRAQTPVS